MADAQVLAPGTKPAPLTYRVPGAQEIIIKAGFATFDGSGAGGSFLPCIRVLAPGGKVVGEYITDSAVAAGDSAEVSFAPFLRNTSGGSPPVSTSAAYALVSRNGTAQSIPDNAATAIAWLHFETSNATVFQTAPGNVSGDTAVVCASDGIYAAWVQGHINGGAGVPRYISLDCGPSDTMIVGNNAANDVAQGATPSASTMWEVQRHQAVVAGVAKQFQANAFQNSGGPTSLSGQTNMVVYYWPSAAGAVIY